MQTAVTQASEDSYLAGDPDWYHSPEGLFRQLWRPQKSCLLLSRPCSGCGDYVGLGGGWGVLLVGDTSGIDVDRPHH